MPQESARLMLSRFGFGLHAMHTSEDLTALAKDPKGALLAELEAGAVLDTPFLFSSSQNVKKQIAFQKMVQEKRTAPAMMQEGENALSRPADVPADIFRYELTARLKAAFTAKIGFMERLVWFYSNHFSISADKSAYVRVLAGSFEREALRPNLNGSFAELVYAVETHPAMLAYLDNARSVGPNSRVGLSQKQGLNENLAREILELHTLGVRSGYTQQDVTQLALLITGWIVPNMKMLEDGQELRFLFASNRHEPMGKTLLNKSFEEGEKGGKDALLMLATHPKTAEHLSFLLAKHFVGDDPPPSLVKKLSQSFVQTKGNLKALAKTLIESNEAWEAPQTKLRRPQEWLMALSRAMNILPDLPRMQNMSNLLGQPFWRPPSPKGFSDEEATWLAGLGTRLDIANIIARNAKIGHSPLPIAEQVLGQNMRQETKLAISRAETAPQGLALLFLSPDFMRR